MKCPCDGCKPPKRTATCHAECEDYKEWKSDRDEKNKKEYERRQALYVSASCLKRIDRKVKEGR